MATCLSTTHPLYVSFQPTKQQKQQQTNPHNNNNKSLYFPLNLPSKTTLDLPLSIAHSISPFLTCYHNHKCNNDTNAFKCFVSSADDAPIDTVEEDEEDMDTETTGAKKKWESVETFTKFYKEAVLSGDSHTIAELEAAFYRLETEKNDLVEKCSTLSEEITAGKERLIRLQADFDNFRKRSEKERLSVRSDAQGEVIESLLPMVDNFERAKQQIKPETDREKQINTSYQGIYKQFVEIMRSLRVSVVATVGKPFDPSLHEAIAREECEEFKEGIVSQEFRRGFILGDRLLRPATVKVSSGPGKKKDSTTQNSVDQPAVTPSSEKQAIAAADVDEP